MSDDNQRSMAWSSMLGMAGMFIFTIALGIFIQPAWNFEDAKAFGEEGSTESVNILLYLMMIFLFTALVIWLARKGRQVLIKAFVLFALWISMIYATFPLLVLGFVMIGTQMPDVAFFQSLDAAFYLSLIISLIAIVGLHKYPEWWVVNGVGMIVGSGVIVMLGISFVPVLVCIFMIAAAIYDYWAVHRSKHMLELADTMIDLKLPVVLVAPKNANYSFRSEQGSMRSSEPVAGDSSVRLEEGVSKKGRDALFMGLGDVIFPGMLVISSLTYMPELGGEVYNPYGSMYLSQILVALGTLVGGLFGYVALMRFVARGNAQPGLPLLNGGAILGYIITGIIVVGPAALWQDISFL